MAASAIPVGGQTVVTSDATTAMLSPSFAARKYATAVRAAAMRGSSLSSDPPAAQRAPLAVPFDGS
jgi:hypothetical protein